MREDAAPARAIGDVELAVGMITGDGEALRHLLRAHGPRVHGLLRGRFGAAVPEEDLAKAFDMAVFQAFWSAYDFDEEEGPLGVWFARLAMAAMARHRDDEALAELTPAEARQALADAEEAPLTETQVDAWVKFAALGESPGPGGGEATVTPCDRVGPSGEPCPFTTGGGRSPTGEGAPR